jgi:hypothetical protein
MRRGEPDRRHYVCLSRALHNQPWTSVDHAVPDSARFFIARISGQQKGTPQTCSQGLDGLLIDSRN